MKEEKNLDDIKELKDEELEAASGGGINFTYPKCGYCDDGFVYPSGKKGVLRCGHCGAEFVNGKRI